MIRTIFLAASLLCPSALASADVIIFNNTAGQFKWVAELYDGEIPGPGKVHLDITRSPDDQDDKLTSSTAWMVHYPAEATPHWDRLEVRGGTGIARGPLQTFLDEEDFPLNIHFARGYVGGDSVGADGTYSSPYSQAHLWLWNYYTDPEITEWFPDTRFIGIRFTLDSNIHYGWIQIAWSHGYDSYPQPLRWGYQTIPEAPAPVIPAPASVLVLAFVLPAFGGQCRRRVTG